MAALFLPRTRSTSPPTAESQGEQNKTVARSWFSAPRHAVFEVLSFETLVDLKDVVRKEARHVSSPQGLWGSDWLNGILKVPMSVIGRH